jgi:apolipoprotein N-acyltransferase
MNTAPGLHPLFVLLLAPFAGALVTLSLAPFDLWPAGIISCALFAYLLCTCSVRQGIWRSWLFGLGLFGSGVSWVYVSIGQLRLVLRALRAGTARGHAGGLPRHMGAG